MCRKCIRNGFYNKWYTSSKGYKVYVNNDKRAIGTRGKINGDKTNTKGIMDKLIKKML